VIALLLDFLRSVPAVVWSGVIASLLTLGGVLLSNWSNTKRLRIQLQHDSAEKTAERRAVLRREVYLKAVEELTKAGSYLSTLPEKDPAKENLGEGVQGFAIAAAKLQLVAEPKTALLANEVAASFGELTVRLLGKVMPLHRARAQIRIHDDLYIEAHAQVKRVLSEMAKLNEAAEPNPRLWEALQRSLDGYMTHMSAHANNRSQAWDLFNLSNAQFQKQLIAELREIGGKQIPLLIEIRRDLGLTTELEAFQAQMEKQWARMSGELAGLFQQLEAQTRELG